MVKDVSLDIPPELAELFAKLFYVLDTRRQGTVAKRGSLPSRAQQKRVSTRSLLPQIAEQWAGLSPAEKLSWGNAADKSGYNGWNLFVQDTAYRIKYGYPGLALPSLYHQYKVGKLVIEAPATEALLAQYHPASYFISKKVQGDTTRREDVKIIEQLVLPLNCEISYKADLSATTSTPTAKFYAKVISSYQGLDIETEIGIDVVLNSDWNTVAFDITAVKGQPRSYDLFLEFKAVRGVFFWDNVRAYHTGNNYARDYRCTDVNNELTRANWQIERSWEEQILPTGAAFDSVYEDPPAVPERYFGVALFGDTP